MLILLKKPFHMLALLIDWLCAVQRRKCPKHGAENNQVSSIFLPLFYSITSWPLMLGYTHRQIWTEPRGEKGRFYSSWSLSLSFAFYKAMADNLRLELHRFFRASATVQQVLNGTGYVPPACKEKAFGLQATWNPSCSVVVATIHALSPKRCWQQWNAKVLKGAVLGYIA